MNCNIIVKALSGAHLGQRITITTKHTTATGVLQGFRHDADAIDDSSFGGEAWARGATRTTITLLPNQTIVANMGDVVVVHGAETDVGSQGPRTVFVVHTPPKVNVSGQEYICYGRAITGRPILKATIIEAPLNHADREWLETYLPAYIAPYGAIVHDYKGGDGGWKHVYMGGAAHQAEMNGENNAIGIPFMKDDRE